MFDRYDFSWLIIKNGKLVIIFDEIFSYGMNFEGGSKFWDFYDIDN